MEDDFQLGMDHKPSFMHSDTSPGGLGLQNTT